MLWLNRRVFAITGLLVGGCAASGPPAARPDAPTRWLLTWHQPVGADAASLRAFDAELSAIAQRPVRWLAAVSETAVAVGIDCPDEAACQAARARLRSDPRVVDIRPDGRRRLADPG